MLVLLVVFCLFWSGNLALINKARNRADGWLVNQTNYYSRQLQY